MSKPLDVPVVYVTMYGACVVGLLGWSDDDAKAFALSQWNIILNINSAGSCHTFTKDGYLMCIIHLRMYNYKPENIALLSHEANHAALSIMSDIGQSIGPCENEYFTYLQQNILYTLMVEQDDYIARKKLKDAKKKKKRRRS